jgi:hypothetical protein
VKKRQVKESLQLKKLNQEEQLVEVKTLIKQILLVLVLKQAAV